MDRNSRGLLYEEIFLRISFDKIAEAMTDSVFDETLCEIYDEI
jgi:hypothetical protein